MCVPLISVDEPPPAFVPRLTGFHMTESLFPAQLSTFFKFLLQLLVLVLPVSLQDKQQPLLCPLGKPHDHKWLDRKKERLVGYFIQLLAKCSELGFGRPKALS